MTPEQKLAYVQRQMNALASALDNYYRKAWDRDDVDFPTWVDDWHTRVEEVLSRAPGS